MRASKWCALAIWLTSLSPAHAQDSAAAAAACDKLATNAQSGCFEKLANAADAKLNKVYRDALKTIDSSAPEQAAPWKAELKKAEQAWISFRDLDCGALTAYEWSHGTGMGAATEHCLLDKTEARTLELQQRYGDR